jgi:hypothetical protein
MNSHQIFMNNLYKIKNNDHVESHLHLTLCLKMIENNDLKNIYEKDAEIFNTLCSGILEYIDAIKIYEHFIRYYDYKILPKDLKYIKKSYQTTSKL